VLGEITVFDASDVGGDSGGGSAIAGEEPVRGPEQRWNGLSMRQGCTSANDLGFVKTQKIETRRFSSISKLNALSNWMRETVFDE
jgi:hypothetical protein